MDVQGLSSRFFSLLKGHDDARGGAISLIAGQNILSSKVAALLSSDLGNRIVETVNGECLFPGMDSYLEMESLGKQICCDALGADATEIRPVTGTLAIFIIYKALLRPGDLVASVSVRDGAHISASSRTIEHLGYRHLSLPFSARTLNLDIMAATELIKTHRPNLIVLGGSVVLFVEAIEQISKVARAIGATLLYDAAHIIGLILSRHVPNPLDAGCDILSFTTCKTMQGPQHALICGRADLLERIGVVSSLWHSGYHLHEAAAAICALIESLSMGRPYSETVIANARSLADALDRNGIPVLRNHLGEATETNMLIVDARKFGGGRSAERLLSESGIFVNRNYLPGAGNQAGINPHGLRIGTAEVTSLGMRGDEMNALAEIFASALQGRYLDSRRRVADMRAKFRAPAQVQ